ncbi:MurR/RpiR family transcriptional regulator, partial [[Clostridium] symbiosum]|uniref:MurR/RpiR family transcriptional regulator n=1 Tax=Clostridium symbiosum TaxID=1512 RepID=UPI0029DF443C|nr:MurR/RpiR family transcriptional regulator [[Clostridium] symbiosum]
MDNNVLSIINENYSALTKTQKKLADFIKDNEHMIPFLSIAELGEKTQVSLASITRFTRELGFNGIVPAISSDGICCKPKLTSDTISIWEILS